MHPPFDGVPDFPAFPPGEVWLAGAGPGDPRLLTLLAVHALRSADEILYDALVSAETLKLARSDAVLRFAGKRGRKPSLGQPDINAVLIEQARAGRRVLRLKGGDPFVFGRGGEEALALAAAGIRFRVIPGVTSGLAATALAGIPVTTRETNHAVVLATGHRTKSCEQSADWEALGRLGQPIVFYMAMGQLANITAALQRGGMLPHTPAAIISAATTDNERLLETSLATAVADAAESAIEAPAIFVVGAIAQLRARLSSSMAAWQ